MRGSDFLARHHACLLAFLLGYHPVVKGFLVPAPSVSCAARIDTRLSLCNPREIQATGPRRVTMMRARLATRGAMCTKDTRSHRLGMNSSAKVVDFEIDGLHHSTAENSHSEIIDPADGDTSAVARSHETNVDHATTVAARVPFSSAADSSAAQDKDAEGGDEGMGGFDFDGAMRSAVDDFVASAKGAAMAVVPLKRRAKDGRLDIDGQGLLNLCILLGAALWAVHSIFTVDATIWRGWTVQETLLRLPWDNWDSYEVGLLEHPIMTKTAINVGIYLIGDWLSQVNWGNDEDTALWEFDLQRTLRNGVIGAIFGPLVHYYYDFSDYILPPNIGMNRPLKIMLDQSIYFISKCAMYITLVSLLRGDSWEATQDTVKGRLKGVVTTGWRFWPFVHVFTYFLIPPRHRVLWVNCVDLLWSSILAGMTSGTPVDAEEEGEPGLLEDGADGAAPASAVQEQPQA